MTAIEVLLPGFSVEIGMMSHQGLVRASNEDAWAVFSGRESPPWCAALLGVFDGVGGLPSGQEASARAAVHMRALLHRPGLSSGKPPEPGAVLERLLTGAHQSLQADAEAKPSLRGMATTATVALLARSSPTTLWVGHVGDSPAFRVRGRHIVKLTVDDRPGSDSTGEVGDTSRSRIRIPHGSYITQALGYGRKVSPHIASHDIQPGDRFLLATDGLTDTVPEQSMLDIVATLPPADACERLVMAANQAGGHDNITTIVVSFNRNT